MTITTPNALRGSCAYQPFDLNATLHVGGNYRVFMGKSISVQVPVRIDLVGGWTDVPEYCNNNAGGVINIAINRFIRAEMHVDDERKISVKYSSDVPVGSGLGTSGALNVALLSTILQDEKSEEQIAELAFQFESLLGNTGGRQDQWASAKGGIQHLQFRGEQVYSEHLDVSPHFVKKIENCFLLFDSGIAHSSGELHSKVWARYRKGDKIIHEALDEMSSMVDEMRIAILENQFQLMCTILQRTTECVDRLGLEFNEPFRDILQPHVGKAVAAWKVMGAGAGGVVGVMLSDEKCREDVIEMSRRSGWTPLEWKTEYLGIQRNISHHG